MDAGKVRMDQTTAVHVLRRTAIVCALIWLILPAVHGAIAWGDWRVVLEMLVGLPIGLSQLLAVGVVASAVCAVSGEFPDQWKLSVDVWILIGLVAGLCLVALLLSWSAPSGLTMPWPWDALLGPAMGVGERFGNWILSAGVIGGALALWACIRVRGHWRWPGGGVGHALAAAAMFVYGGLLSTLAVWQYWPLGLALASVCAYGVCYALGLVTLRADEFEAACQLDAGPRPTPSVRLTLLLLVLSVGASLVLTLIVPWSEIVPWRRWHVTF